MLISGKRIETNIALADQALVSALHFLIGIILARRLGMTGYGEYVLAYGVVLFFSACQANLVIAPMMVRMPLVKAEEKKLYFWSVLFQQMLLACSVALVLFAAFRIVTVFFPAGRLERLLWPTCAAVVSCLAQDFFRKYFFAANRPWAAFMNDACCYGLQAGLLLYAAGSYPIDAGHALWIIAFSSAAAIGLGGFQADCFRLRGLPSRAFLKDKLVENLHFGKWLLGGDLMYWAQNQFVNYFCAGTLSVGMVGAMNAARNITGVVNVLFLGIMNFLPPRAAAAFGRGGREMLNSYLLRASFRGGLVTLAIVLIASLGRETWLQILYGSEYAGYGWIVIWWSVYSFIGFFLRPVCVGLQVLNETKAIFLTNLAGLAIMLAISYPLLAAWQVNGLMLMVCLNNAVVLAGLVARYGKAAGTAAPLSFIKKSTA